MTNPFGMLVPAGQQPAAGQPTLQQAPQVLPAGQYPGAGQSPGFGQPSSTPTLTGVATGQPQGGLPVNLPQLQPYNALQPYYASLSQQPQLQMPQYDDATLQAIQQKLLALGQSNPVLSGAAPPHPASQVARAQAPMSPLQILGAAGQSLWQQEVVQPVQDYIRTWQTNPGQGLLETLGGIAVIGGIVGLEAITGGAATPFIFGAMAALQAPSLISAWSDEVRTPTDGNLVKALVSTGAGALAVGSPVRAFRGLSTARSLLDTAVAARKDISSADEAAGLLLGGREAMRGQLRTGVPLQRQVAVFASDTGALVEQLRESGAALDDAGSSAAAYVAARRTQDALRQRLQTASEAGDTDAVQNLLGEIRDRAKSELAPAMLAAAHDHLFMPFTPYTHVPLSPIEGVAPETQSALDGHLGAVRGLLREVHNGNSLQGLHEPATKIESILEQRALDQGAGTAFDMANRTLTHIEKAAREIGLEGIADPGTENILQALEEPEKWKALEPDQQAFGQMLRNVSDMMTVGELRFGTIGQALQGRIAHYFQGVAGDKEADPVGMFSSWLRMPTGSRSRFWKAAVDGETGEIQFVGKTRSEIIDQLRQQTKFYQETHEHRQVYGANRDIINKLRRSFGQLEGRLKRATEAKDAGLIARYRQRIDEMMAKAHGDMGALAPELIGMELKQLRKIRRAKPATHELVTGGEAIRQMVARHLTRMHQAVIGEGLRSHANLNLQKLRAIFDETPVKHWGAAMALPEFKSEHELPDILPETVFLGQSRNAGAVEDNARRLGYFLAHPAIGSSRDLHYRPALYARGELANQIQKSADSVSASEQQHGLLNSLYHLGSVSKRFIMYSPMYHLTNVAGRALAFVLNDPAVAGSAFKAVNQLKQDAESYHALLEEAGAAGLVHANRWNVTAHLQRLQREEDGQHHFLGALRHFGRAIDDMHSEWAERGLWGAVDHLQLAGYLYAKSRFTERGIDAVEARRLAAQYANTLGGLTNPLYMSRLWRHMKSQVWFAPSYWATFLHALQSVMPGASRISSFTAKNGGGRFVRLSAVPLRAIDDRSRRELVRAQRSWMVTYLATGIVSMDMLNVMLSGHHLWDNEQGRMMDVDVTNLAGTQTTPSGEVRHAYITSMPFFRQAVDLGNAIGLGHDYGFAHNFGDTAWQQQDDLHKAEWVLSGLVDGVRRTASTKVAQVPQAAYGLATGEEMTARLGEGVQQQVDRPQALISLLPNGYQFQRLIKQYQQPQTPQTQSPSWLAFAKDSTISMLANSVGLPSVYHMGVEAPPIDDSKYNNWQAQRTAIHNTLLAYSRSLFAGQMQPQEYSRKKHDQLIRMNQLNKDTWGENSPGASLSAAYQNLSKQFKLDDQTLTDQQWYQRYDAFLPAWQQMLQSASPATRAAWWEHDTQQWTDADYLEWEAQQLKQALAASIDGQGGAHIRAFQSQLYQLQPTMTTAEFTELENSDPYYSVYRSLLSSMGQTSPLGAFVSAFSSPFTQTEVLPQGFTQAQAQDLAQHTGKVVVRGEEAQALAQQAREVAQEPEVQQSGGQAAAGPGFQQQAGQAFQAAETGVPTGGQ